MPRVVDLEKLRKHLHPDNDHTFLLLFAGDGATAREVHDVAVAKIEEPWRRTLLIEDLSILDEAEEAGPWEVEPDRYVVLGDVDGEERSVAKTGALEDLLTGAGKPSILAIKDAFTRGEAP